METSITKQPATTADLKIVQQASDASQAQTLTAAFNSTLQNELDAITAAAGATSATVVSTEVAQVPTPTPTIAPPPATSLSPGAAIIAATAATASNADRPTSIRVLYMFVLVVTYFR